MKFTSETIESDSIQIIGLEGQIDIQTAATLEEKLREMLQEPVRVILDLGQVSLVTSAGLRVLLVVHKMAAAEPAGGMVLCNVQPSVEKVLIISNFNRVFQIAETREEALEKFRQTSPDSSS